MKDKTFLKLLLDIAMSVLYLMLMFSRRSGAFFHEAVGIGVVALFAAHLLLNRKMTRGLLASAKRGAARPARKLLLLSDLLLCTGMPVTIATGILISRELFHTGMRAHGALLPSLHNTSAYVCLCALAAHALLHAKYLSGALRKLKKIQGREIRRALCRFGAGALALVLLYSAAYFSLDRREDGAHIPLQAGATGAGAPGQPTASGTDLPLAETEDVPSLEEYLGGQNCNGCSRGCSLLEPGCRRGQARLQQAKEAYAGLYGTNEAEETEK